jgi:hypothetical protein
MKYIFRYALITNFTDNKEGVTLADLRETLATLKYNCPNAENVVKQWAVCIEELVRTAPLKPDTLNSIIKKHASANITEQDINDMAAVWESENDQIFIYRLKRSIGHASLERLEWSVNNRVYGKHCQNVNQLSTIVNMTLRHPNTQKTTVTFELDK